MRNQSITTLFKCLSLAFFIFGAGCNKDDKPKPKEALPGYGTLENQKPNFPAIRVIDEAGNAIAGAQVLVGMAEGAYEDNFGSTNQQGDFPLPANWTSADVVTVDAPGYVRASYLGLMPETKVITLKKKFNSKAQLKGVTSGHPVKHKDGNIDFALVMSAMTRQDLLNFQIQKILSPVNDKITVKGQEMSVPSNISLPNQTENYLFFSVNINKPAYRLFFADKGVQRVFAARGRFPFKEVVDGMRNESEIFELINLFSLTGGTIRDIELKEDSTVLDIPVMDITFNSKKAFKAPKLSSNQVMVAVTVSDRNGYLIPTDVKRLRSEQASNLAVLEDAPAFLAQVIKNKDEFDSKKPGLDRLSAVLLPFDEKVAAEYLPLITSPSAKGRNIFVIPQVSSNLNQLTTFGLISDVKTEKDSKGEIKKIPEAVWEVYAPGWVAEIKLPEWKWNKAATATRFEVSLVGTTSSDTIPLGPQMMEKATHVTRSSVDY